MSDIENTVNIESSPESGVKTVNPSTSKYFTNEPGKFGIYMSFLLLISGIVASIIG